MDNYIGMKLDGRYELIEQIGSGGMAEIYKAEDTVENKTVAVKILKNEFAGSEEFLRRFRNESKAIALLSHTNIVKIFDVGFTESVQFIVMEHIDGITLIDYIEKQGVLKWRDALGFTQQILKALQHAHDRGIVHRDVKSQNVMLLRDGTIKVMDFGIARFNREIDKTMTEKAIGSVHYISPEQARGAVTDEKSDLYSVGVMLYEMLTGIKPFDGDDALAIALMHTNKNPKPPSEINSSIPEGLEEITLRAMQKETPKRYQTAGEMLGDLQEFESNPSVIFEYKYSTPDGNTKHFDKVGNAAPAASAFRDANEPVELDVDFDDEDGEDYDDDEVIERRSPLLPILFAVASAFVIITAAVIAAIFGGLIGGEGGGPFSRNREMPNLVEMDYYEAMRAYDWLQLNPVMEHSADFPKDTIFDQSIPAGRMFNPNQTVVNVTVSSGRKVIYMPDFTRNAILGSEVVEELRRMGLQPTPHQIFDDNVPEGYFIRSDRRPNDELEEGAVVKVFISNGADIPETTMVPNFVGVSEHTARELAVERRLTLKVTPEESPEEQKGTIVRQSIPEHSEVNNNTVVEVFIGTGKPEEPTEDEENEFFITFNIGSAWTGEYEFKMFRNGVQVDTRVQNVSLNRTFRWEFSDTEVQEYSVIIRNPATGKEGIYLIHEIDFTDDPPKRTVKESNPGVFAEISTPDVATQ
jgi:serine/threonine-protein kinase